MKTVILVLLAPSVCLLPSNGAENILRDDKILGPGCEATRRAAETSHSGREQTEAQQRQALGPEALAPRAW